ncbi:Acetyltransferase (GNAT) domain-containing protein [Pedobacter steynii]|uniref:Acetyltransferase (GNAT) domain-containing protein n=1 Tax=Pedobacter steynii TaxID=430522 RepID=A0A1H0CJ05_9SPHI|nr:GNAT family N-acetyltransferase [Pedobacter steynii]NQX41582.1 GNAT family N-acetyltransferase [Pedobacter steynii]SDN57846.1 Acetyltransferase (GNAT) domain-containing protein [Pedobacter steynii]
MGNLRNGLFGGFHGRIGNLVGYTLKGKHVIRTIGKSSKPLTPARKANCEKMKVVNEILKPSIHAIRAGFRLAVTGTDRNEYNEAVSYNKKNAVQGIYPDISLDYTKVLMSMGTLPVAINPGISQNQEKITFTWEISASPASEYHTDRTMLVIYFPDIKETCCQLVGAKRVEGKDLIVISQEHVNQRMEAYISFAKDNGKAVSNSIHAGSLNRDRKTEITDHSHLEMDQLIQKVSGDLELKLNQDDARIAELRINSSPDEQPDLEEFLSSTLSVLFEKTKVNRLVVNTNANNLETISLLKLMGFRKEGHFIENRFVNGKWINEYQFALLKSEWDLLND